MANAESLARHRLKRQMRPTVSVVLIVRNGERYIVRALRSVIGGTVPPDEILVVDGGSTDRTVELASGLPTVRVLPQQSTGLTEAYNEGIAAARGEFIGFISHDDEWLPEKLERQLAVMTADPSLRYTVTHIAHHLEPGASIPPGFRADLLGRLVPGFVMEALVARRELFAEVGGLDAAFDVSSDTDWFARVRDAGVPCAVLPETLVHKRVHTANSSLLEPQIATLLLRAMRHSLHRKRAAGRIA
jgi:glycosyltransferase involved in cell wall biosynthesis